MHVFEGLNANIRRWVPSRRDYSDPAMIGNFEPKEAVSDYMPRSLPPKQDLLSMAYQIILCFPFSLITQLVSPSPDSNVFFSYWMVLLPSVKFACYRSCRSGFRRLLIVGCVCFLCIPISIPSRNSQVISQRCTDWCCTSLHPKRCFIDLISPAFRVYCPSLAHTLKSQISPCYFDNSDKPKASVSWPHKLHSILASFWQAFLLLPNLRLHVFHHNIH